MLNKNDPLIGAVQQVMQKSNAEREAVKVVNERFGIQDRKALPHEYQGQWNAEYNKVLSESADLARETPPYNQVTKKDVLFRRGVLKKHPTKPGRHVLATEGSDETSPSSMGINKPDYATGTPDYAKPKTQTVNRGAKTSLPAGTMKEEKSKAWHEKQKKIADAIKRKNPKISDEKKFAFAGAAANKAMSEELEAIQEEISYNLTEQAYNIFENDGAEDLVAFINSLNEEQLELLGMNEEFIEFVINEGLWDSISAGARGAWDSATLGAGKYVSGAVRHGYKKLTGQKSNYLDQVDQEDKANKESEKNNPKAYNAGWYGGLAASMIAPGGAAVQGAKLAGKAALKAGAKSLGASTAKAAGVGVGVGTADALRDIRNKPAMNEEFILENLEAIQEELANHLYENYTLEEINSLTEEDLNYMVYESSGLGGFIGNLIGRKVVAPAVTATAKKTAQASANVVKKQAAQTAAKRFNVAGAQPVVKAPKAKKAATTAAAPAASSTVSQTTKVLDKLKGAGTATAQAIKNNPGKTALGIGAGMVGAAALTSDDDKASSEPPKYTGDVKYTQGSADSQRAMSTTGQAAAKPPRTTAKSTNLKTTTKVKKKVAPQTAAPKVAAQPKNKLTAFQKSMINQKGNTMDQTRQLERRYGVRAPMKKAKRSIFKEQIRDIIAEKAMGGMVAQQQAQQQSGISAPASRLGRVAQRPISAGSSGMPTSGVASTRLTAAGSMNPFDRRNDMQRATQNAGAMAVDRNKASAPRPGERVPGEKVGTNTQMAAQASARKGFGAPAGGNYKAAQALPRNPANFPTDVKTPATPPTNWPGGRPQPGTLSNKINQAGRVAPGASSSAPTQLKPATVMSKSPSFEFSAKQREAAKAGKASAADVQSWAKSRGVNPNDKGLLRNYLNAAQNKTMKTGSGAVSATGTQKSAQSSELKMKAGMAQRGRPAGVSE